MSLWPWRCVRCSFRRLTIYFKKPTAGHFRINSYVTFALQALVINAQKLRSFKMSQSAKLPDWMKISSSFDSAGKRHILPLSLLMRFSSRVQENKELFTAQILKEGLGPVTTPVSTASCSEDIDGDSASGEYLKHADQQTKKKKCKRGQPAHSEDGNEVKKARTVPNFFVAVQVTNPEIHIVAKKIQTGIQKNARANLRHAIIGVEKFHITLMVMHLPDEVQVKTATETLEKCVPSILEKTCGQPITLDFEGLSTFNGGRVLFASLKATKGLDHLHLMADEISMQMKVNGIVSTDKPGRKFNPHLTLIKFKGGRGIKKVEASMYEPYVKEVFGTQTISSMQLCHMEKKRKDGYYLVEHEVFFNK